MQIGMSVIACSFVYLSLLAIVYFNKERVKTFETKLYSLLLMFNVIGLALEFMCCLTVKNMEIFPILNTFINRMYLIYFVTYIIIFTIYVYHVSFSKDVYEKVYAEQFNKGTKMLFVILYVVSLLLVVVLPLYYHSSPNAVYSYGPATDYLTILCFACMVIDLYCLLKNIKNIKTKKNIPLFILLICFFIAFIVRNLDPSIILINSSFGLITAIMYFTIENPDLKMLREFHKAREYANNLNTEKSEFLFNMAGEIKAPISVINRISKEVLMQDDINVIKSKVNDIKYSSNNLLELVNKVLDINSLEKRKVSVRESKYNTSNLFKGIESQTEIKLNNNLVKFRTNYDKSIPNELYGDSVRIRQIVNTLLENAIKYTKEGFIELGVNSIVKHDICRLVITVEDSGVGMTQDIVEHLFDKKLEKIEEIDNPKMDLGLVKTLLDLIGGTIIVNSELNHGTKFTIVLDQKVVNHKKNKTIEAVEKYEEMYLNNKKVMCVINDDALTKKINTLFKKYQLDIEVVKLGQSCLEKVRAGEKFDLIIMEEHLEKLSSENTLAKLKLIQGFKTPVILLTDIKDINEKEEYLKLGFTEIITLPLKKERVEEVVHNYKLINK